MIDHQFLKETNGVHNDIKFTVEKSNKTMNNLELTLTVKNNMMTYMYKIYRKPTHSDTIISKDSFHHPKYWMEATENYCYRAMIILKDEEVRMMKKKQKKYKT